MKQFSLLLTALLCAVAVLSGCSGSANSDNQTSNTPNATGKATADTKDTIGGSSKLKIDLTAGSFNGGGWPDNNYPTIQYLDQKFNMDLNVQWIPGANLTDKLNVLAASGNLPDLFILSDPNILAKWQNEGVFLDLQPYLKDYPNLAKEFPEDMMTMYNPPGKLYGLPKYAPEFQTGIVVREDWLKKLNMALPNPDNFTIDDFYNISKAFADGDPDGDGKKDTSGFSVDMSTTMAGLDINHGAFLEAAFGLNNGWKLENGKLVPMEVQSDQWKTFLTFMQKAYKEGVLDQDFATDNDAKLDQKASGNKVGWSVTNWSKVQTEQAQLQKINNNALLTLVAPPKGPGGRGNYTATSGTTKIVLNSKLSKDKIKRILTMLDWWVTDEGTTVMYDGPEGVIWTKDTSGKVTLTDEGKKVGDRAMLLTNWFFRPAIANQTHGWEDQALAKKQGDFVQALSSYPWRNDGAAYTVFSPTYGDKAADLDGKFNQAVANIIAGRQPVSSIDGAIAQWKSGGGDQITKEINDIYAKQK